MKKTFVYLILFFGSIALLAQHPVGTEHRVKRAIDKIVLDGQLIEESWVTAQPAKDFFMSKPYDSIAPVNQTFFRITFDDDFLYIGFECRDDGKGPIVQSLRRDFEFRLNDNVGIYFDPFNDFTNGFYFNISPHGVQREGLIANGGSAPEDFSTFWDNKWYSAVKRFPDYWIAEIAIPFKTIRYNMEEWHFNVLRNDMERNQVSSWVATPVQYLPASFAWSGKMIWDDPLPKPGLNISVIPYVAGSTAKSNEENLPTEQSAAVGFDAKIGLSPSLNMDLTVNPDFSQVEVDQQVINLTRFEFEFPERRQFFLENSDLFSQPGFPNSRPFFSRRIGLASDSTGALQKVPILYGARISGKIGKNYRVGIMNLQTREAESLGLPDQNYSVGVLQRQIFSRSNIGVVFINKQSLGLSVYDPSKFYHGSLIHEEIDGADTTNLLNTYNRVAGLDFNLFSKNTKWRGDVYYHLSFDDFSTAERYSTGGFIGYYTRNLNVIFGVQSMGKNFNAETGFTPNLGIYAGYTSGITQVDYILYPQSKTVASHGPSFFVSGNGIPTGLIADKNYSISYSAQFLNTSAVAIKWAHTYQYLTRDFNPIKRDKDDFDSFAEADDFDWDRVEITYQSDQRKVFNFRMETGYGGFYSGTGLILTGEVNYRYQPFGNLGIRVNYNHLKLPENFGEKQLLLIGPRLDLTFTEKIFFTTFVQFNNREENVNLNARFQWRFKPASDFFIVYTENYLSTPLKSKDRSLVVKFTYWFNL